MSYSQASAFTAARQHPLSRFSTIEQPNKASSEPGDPPGETDGEAATLKGLQRSRSRSAPTIARNVTGTDAGFRQLQGRHSRQYSAAESSRAGTGSLDFRAQSGTSVRGIGLTTPGPGAGRRGSIADSAFSVAAAEQVRAKELDGQVQREVSLAKKRSRESGLNGRASSCGWGNVAMEEANKAPEVTWR